MKKSEDNMKNKVFEAITSLIPENERTKVTEAIEEFLDETAAALDAEYTEKLNDAYATIEAEKQEIESIGVKGYHEAYETIVDLNNRLEKQKEEYNTQLEEGYQEALAMIVEERSKNETLELKLYEQYEHKLNEVKEYLVEKIDKYLEANNGELYEMAKKEVMNDPYMLEHKVAWDKVLNLASEWLSDEDFNSVASSKVEELGRKMDEQRQQIKMLESKNTKLVMDRDALHEQVRASQGVITENVAVKRAEKVKKAEGRGFVETDKSKQVVIAEAVETAKPVEEKVVLTEQAKQWVKLAYDPKD